MKAIVYTKYGPAEVLQLKEIAKPIPQDNQVLVRVHASSVNALDSRRFVSQSLIGKIVDTKLLKAIGTVLGVDFAGEVEAVGRNVKQFKPGDAVFGRRSKATGSYAEYTCAPEDGIILK